MEGDRRGLGSANDEHLVVVQEGGRKKSVAG